MISFYPGPSQTHPRIRDFMVEACDSGILSVNHRSAEFVDVSKKAISLLKEKLDIPPQYTVFFTSSATECWEIIGQSYIGLYSFHIYNGAFGEKWLNYRKKLSPNASGFAFSIQRSLPLTKIRHAPNLDLICLTQNETSNGTQVGNRVIRRIRQMYKDSLICVDATSSMAGISLDWLSADIWFASVQKCFGLPAGMAVMVCSPRALEVAQQENNRQHYNNLPFMEEKMRDWQTTHTPNVLGIFLLMKVMEVALPITKQDRLLKERAQRLSRFLMKNGFPLLIENSQVRSHTVIAVRSKKEKIENIKKAAKRAGFLLGNGYGTWKETTFRIANFPALGDEDFEGLMDFLKNWTKKNVQSEN